MCPTCRASQATDDPSPEFLEEMGQLTLVQAGAVVTASSRKARKAVKTAMRLYEELYGLYEGAALTIPDVGIAFLRSVGAAGKVPQMSKHRLALSELLVEKGREDWTLSDLCKAAMKEPKQAMTKAPSPSDRVTREIIKQSHEDLSKKMADGTLHPLIGTRTNVGQHGSLGGALRSNEMAGGDIDHGPHCGNLLLSMFDEEVVITPHAVGEVPGSAVRLLVPFSVIHLEEHKTSLEESRILIAGVTFRRRVEELAAAWNRPWKYKVELKGHPGKFFKHMDYKVLRIGLQGVNLKTPMGEIFETALVQTQTQFNHDKVMTSPTMIKWLKTTIRQRCDATDVDLKWIHVMDGTEEELDKFAPTFIHELQVLYDQLVSNLWVSSDGRFGGNGNGGKISASVRWGPVLCSTTGVGARIRVKTPMPLTVKSFEGDVSAVWLTACGNLGIKDCHPTSHGGRREACNLAVNMGSQAGISPVNLRERVNYFFRWTPEKDRQQLHYSGHLSWSEQLKMTVMFWLAGSEFDY